MSLFRLDRLVVLAVLIVLMGVTTACQQAPPEPTPDIPATVTAQVERSLASQATPTPAPTWTPPPIVVQATRSSPTSTPVPPPTETPTPAPTATPAPAPTDTPSPAPTQTATPAPGTYSRVYSARVRRSGRTKTIGRNICGLRRRRRVPTVNTADAESSRT